MSTSPDEIVSLLSRWLARHVGDDELQRGVESIGRDALSGEQAEAVDELRAALADDVPPARLEVAVRETLEALALG